MEKLEFPLVAGMPEIAPLLLPKVKPAGKAPPVIAHWNGVFPPWACRSVLYAVPCVAPGSAVAVTAIFSSGVTMICELAVFAPSARLVAVTSTMVGDPTEGAV